MRLASYGVLLLCVVIGFVAPKCFAGACAHAHDIDLAIVALAGVSFFSVVQSAAKIVPTNKLSWMRDRLTNQLGYIDALHRETDHLRAPQTPSRSHPLADPTEVAEHQRQQRLSHEWIEEFGRRLAAARRSKAVTLAAVAALAPPEGVTSRSLAETIEALREAAAAYETQRAEVMALEREAAPDLLESVSALIAPFTAAAAIGLGVYKAVNF